MEGLSPLAIDKIKQFIPVDNGQGFVLEFIDALVKIEEEKMDNIPIRNK